MTKKEIIQIEKRFDYLFDRVCKIGYMELSEEQRKEYWRLNKILDDVKNAKILHEIIASGDYRIGY